MNGPGGGSEDEDEGSPIYSCSGQNTFIYTRWTQCKADSTSFCNSVKYNMQELDFIMDPELNPVDISQVGAGFGILILFMGEFLKKGFQRIETLAVIGSDISPFSRLLAEMHVS